MGKRICDMYGIYANNFNLRHDNSNPNDSHYKETIAKLSDDELIKWYDYIYAFMLNIYLNINDLTDVNINGNFEVK